MPLIRVACFIDGFNIYHAINDLRRNELKWVDLRKLMACFTDPKVHALGPVYYFSAYATWLSGPFALGIISWWGFETGNLQLELTFGAFFLLSLAGVYRQFFWR